MQFSKSMAALAISFALRACSSNMSQDGSLQKAQQTYQQYEEITKQFHVNDQWWLGYHDNQLNRLVDMALANNLDLAKAAIAVNRAYYNANLVGANLVPVFNGSASSSLAKGVGSPDKNQVSTGTSTTTEKLGFNMSYTIDL